MPYILPIWLLLPFLAVVGILVLSDLFRKNGQKGS